MLQGNEAVSHKPVGVWYHSVRRRRQVELKPRDRDPPFIREVILPLCAVNEPIGCDRNRRAGES